MDTRKLNGAELAYLGDSVLELYARVAAINKELGDIGKQNEFVVGIVNAKAQSRAMDKIEQMLSEDEMTYFKLGRNSHVSVPKSASSAEYHRATGMESLFGYLFLEGKEERAKELFAVAYSEQLNKSEE